MALAAPSLAAAQPSCGDVVTHNVTLIADLGPCSGNGLSVGKAGITINLNGHTISGNNGCCYAAGIDNAANYSGSPGSGFNGPATAAVAAGQAAAMR